MLRGVNHLLKTKPYTFLKTDMTTRRRTPLAPKPVAPEEVPTSKVEDIVETPTPVEICVVDEVAEVLKDIAVAELFVSIPPAPNSDQIAEVVKPQPRYLLRNNRHAKYVRG